jgi:hypothetical protein
MDKNKAIKILDELKGRIPSIKEEESPLRSPKFLKWQLDTQTAIEKIFPDNEGHVHRFNSINYRTSAYHIQPLEWSQATKATGEATPYVGQILDKAFSMAQAVVVLMTPDDVAYLRKEFQSEHDEEFEKNPTAQARPNVLFEAGMAMGRDVRRTVLVQVGTLRPFSDVGGRHILRLNNNSARRQDLAERLKTAGCDVDLTGRDWHTAGSFELNEAKQSVSNSIENPTAQNPKITVSNPAEVVPGLTVAEAEIIQATPDHGWIYLMRSAGHGQFVNAGKGDFFRETDASHQAKYVDALESLLAKNLIRSEGKDAFRLTGRGFDIRNSLKATGPV